LAYNSNLKMEPTFSRICNVETHKFELFVNSALRASDHTDEK
jgi:hypothetical protein